MKLEEFLNPEEQIVAQVAIDYAKGTQVQFGVSNKRCFIFEDTSREQSFISGVNFEYLKVQKPKMNILLLVLGIILLVAYGAGLILILIAWILSKDMLVTTEVGVIELQYVIKKSGQIHQMAQFMQFVHSRDLNIPTTPLQISRTPRVNNPQEGDATLRLPNPSPAPVIPNEMTINVPSTNMTNSRETYIEETEQTQKVSKRERESKERESKERELKERKLKERELKERESKERESKERESKERELKERKLKEQDQSADLPPTEMESISRREPERYPINSSPTFAPTFVKEANSIEKSPFRNLAGSFSERSAEEIDRLQKVLAAKEQQAIDLMTNRQWTTAIDLWREIANFAQSNGFFRNVMNAQKNVKICQDKRREEQ